MNLIPLIVAFLMAAVSLVIAKDIHNILYSGVLVNLCTYFLCKEFDDGKHP